MTAPLTAGNNTTKIKLHHVKQTRANIYNVNIQNGPSSSQSRQSALVISFQEERKEKDSIFKMCTFKRYLLLITESIKIYYHSV